MSRRLFAPVLTALLAAAACVAVVVPGAGASTDLLGGLLPFGCANPGGHRSTGLLPAAQGSSETAVTCFGRVERGAGFLSPKSSAGPVGYGPSQIQSAYRIAGKHVTERSVAVIDAYDDPHAEADLAVYRQSFGLRACTTANHCFRKVNQNGAAAPLPARDYGWGEEISLDIDAVSATCPDCHILLVEATSPNPGPLMAAVDSAARLGASAISISWGGAESKNILSEDKHLYHPYVPIAVSAGDEGYGAEWPASSRYVTAVGGTTLRASSSSRGWTETAWRRTGSGCSKYEPKPSWQHDSSCSRRTVGDVSAVGDPATGLGVYDTLNSCSLALLCDGLINSGAAQGLNGWAKIGGTSLSAPVIASLYALSGNHQHASYAYAHRTSFTDVRSGANGSCRSSYLCTAKAGYDGPSGLGTPLGLGAF